MDEKPKKKRIASRILSVLSGLLVGGAAYYVYSTALGFGLNDIPQLAKIFEWTKYGIIAATAVLALLGLLNIPVGFKIFKMLLCAALAGALVFVQIKGSYYIKKIYGTVSPIPQKGKTEFSIYVPNGASDVNPGVLGTLSNYDVDNLQEEALKQLNGGSYTVNGYTRNLELLDNLDEHNTGGVVMDWRYVQASWDHYRFHGQSSYHFYDFENQYKKFNSVTLEYDCPSSLEPYTGNLTDKAFVVALGITDQWNYYELGPDGYTARTHDNIAFVVNPVTKDIMLVLFPRDALVMTTINGREGRDVLCRTSLYGTDAWVKAMESLLGCPVDIAVRLEMTDLIPLIDAIGGVTVDNPLGFPSKTVKVMQDGQLLPYPAVFEKGEIKLDGKQAYVYMTEYEELVNGEEGRPDHILRVLTGIVNHGYSLKYLFDNRDTLLDAAQDIVKTNVELSHLVKTILNSPSLLGEYNIKPYSFTGYGSAAECLSMYSQFVGGFQIHFSQLERFQATVKAVLNNEGIPL